MKAALCIRIKRKDQGILRAASWDRDIVITAPGFEGTYRSRAALGPTIIKSTDDLAVDNVTMAGVVSMTVGVTQQDIEAGLWDEAFVTFLLVNPDDPSTLINGEPLHSGMIGKLDWTSDANLDAESRSDAQRTQQQMFETNTKTCRATLGSGAEVPLIKRCGVDLSTFEVSASVSSQDLDSPRRAFTSSGLTQDAGYFTFGLVTFTSGANDGFTREVKVHRAGGEIVLFEPLPHDIEDGDQFDITPGCDKRFATCRDTFDNAVNFRGEPYILGPRFITQIGGR